MRSQPLLLVVLAVPLASATRLESFHAGMHAHKAGNLDEALTHFRAAIEADGSLGADDVSLNLVAGELMVQRGLANEAVGCFQHAIELCAEHNLSAKQQAICQYSLALALEEAGGDEARVEALYRQASGAGLAAAHFNLAGLLGQQVANTSAMEEALELYDKLVRREPSNPVAWSAMANVLRRRGLRTAAGLARAHALAAAPSDADLWVDMSEAFRKGMQLPPWLAHPETDPWGEKAPQPSGAPGPPDLRSARRCLRRALRLDPDHPQAAHLLAMCDAAMEREAAERAAERLSAAAEGESAAARPSVSEEEEAWWAALLGEGGEEAEAEEEEEEEEELGGGWAMPTVRAPPERASGRYLAATFDAQAASFDHELGRLRYAAPEH